MTDISKLVLDDLMAWLKDNFKTLTDQAFGQMADTLYDEVVAKVYLKVRVGVYDQLWR